MAKQSLVDYEQSSSIRISKRPSIKAGATKLAGTSKGRVIVAPYVRMVRGKPVYVAGYSYSRK